MHLNFGLHLAYCTNVHPGEDWAETLNSLEQFTLPVKRMVCPEGPFAIGLRLSDLAARELSLSGTLSDFQRWLERHNCYVFTINGFPFGNFHGKRIKEQVYLPDWTSPQRVEYTNRLFDLLAALLPSGVDGSVSTLPGGFKPFIKSKEQERSIRDNLWRCFEHIARTSERSARTLHLGLEPEPFCLLENSSETADFFDRLRDEHPNDERFEHHLGINYDACHFALAFEEPGTVLRRFQQHHIRLSKIHISNALNLRPTAASLAQLTSFQDSVYLHQTAIREHGRLVRQFLDLDEALASPEARNHSGKSEWRVHFHVPLHASPPEPLETTRTDLTALFDLLKTNPEMCNHLEMETYTWAVLPEALKTRAVTDQIFSEYRWTLEELSRRGLAHLPVGIQGSFA
jgi:sugar phosphate isomerase/epimerase